MTVKNPGAISEIQAFIEGWKGEAEPMRDCFVSFFKELSAFADTTLTFIARPGVSYSIRPRHIQQKDREMFAIVDVIDDDPQDRWLSVCFYEDMITDPEGRGELIPGGLGGSDGYCFDLYDDDAAGIQYVLERITEAAAAAAS